MRNEAILSSTLSLRGSGGLPGRRPPDPRSAVPILLAAAIAATLPLRASPAGGAPQPSQPRFSSGISLVEVYATVTDSRGAAIRGLTAADFHVLEDGQPQAISAFAAGDFPLAVALAVDRSVSMTGETLALAKSAARSFLEALRPADRSMIIAIGSEIEVVAPLSRDRAAQLRALARLEPWGTTPLYDSIVRAIDLLEPAPGRRALVLLSDGIDRYSSATADDALDHARRSDVIVYPIDVGRQPSPFFPELAALTGGRSFQQRDPRKLATTLAAIGDELRFQYLLGYAPFRPISPGRPEWRAIRVTVDRPDARVRARDGYLAR